MVALMAIEALTDAVKALGDATQKTLSSIEQHPRALLEALPAAVYITDTEGRITFYNQAAADLWGQAPQLGTMEWCGSWRLYWPDGRPMPHHECPMAVAIRERRAIRGAEAIAERPDGTRVPFLAYPTPIWDDAGELTGAINTLIDITERKQREEFANRLASIVESSQDAIVSKDLNGVVATWNKGAEKLFGYTAAEMIGKEIVLLIPEDHPDEEPAILERIRRGERVEQYETIRRRKDGSLVEIALTVSPVKDAAGHVIGASKIARDITESKRAEERQILLLREMNHRIKNLFALASSVVAVSKRSADSVEELADAVQGRLSALARAHDLTLPDMTPAGAGPEKTTTLRALLEAIIAPFDGVEHDGESRVAITGPEISIGGRAVTGLALLLHEFATNAVKYGALSCAGGRINVSWPADEGALHLIWEETGVKRRVRKPEGEGFGSLLVRATVSGQLGGQMTQDWRADGLTIRVSASSAALAG